ncbi:MAG: hypothetical protein ACJAQS_001860 [Porticoccus sp.]|jgi:hypothetical protein
MLARQISVQAAIQQAADTAAELNTLAAEHRGSHCAVDQPQAIRHWHGAAGTYCYQTHITISAQPIERLAWLTDAFYNTATLSALPWYPQFKRGKRVAVKYLPATDTEKYQLSWVEFDLGLKAPRHYRQLVYWHRPNANLSIITARSVDTGPALPATAKLATIVSPNGELLYWENDCLH